MVQTLPQAGAAGKIDNEFDVDWFALNIAEAGTKKTFTLNGTSYAKSNFRMIVLDKNLNYVERSSTNNLDITFVSPGTYYIGVYAKENGWQPNQDQSYELQQNDVALETFSLVDVKYNKDAIGNDTGPKLGKGNRVTVTLKKGSPGAKQYTVQLWCAGNDTDWGAKRSTEQTVTLSNTSNTTITFDNVDLYGGTGFVYTFVKVYETNAGLGIASERDERVFSGMMPQKLAFTKQLKTNNKNHKYLFDDNHERIRMQDMADGSTPTTIAHFGTLGPGVYTFFGYHNKDEANTISPLYFDPVFYNTSGSGTVKMRKVGYSTDWDWNQAWADFSGQDVDMPKFYNFKNGQTVEYSESRENTTGHFKKDTMTISPATKTWFSDFLNSPLTQMDGGVVWIMMEFEVTGTVQFDTLAYSNAAGKNSLDINGMAKGEYERDEQYKGTADNAPRVETELNYYIDQSVRQSERLPVKIQNQFFTDWTPPDFGGRQEYPDMFTTHVNSYTENNWRSAVENDMMVFEYTDPDGTEWTFDCRHSEATPNTLLNKNGSPPRYKPDTTQYGLACNLGNYGVTYTYTINIHNSDDVPRYFNYYITSEGFQVYDYKVYYDGVKSTLKEHNKPQALKETHLGEGWDITDNIVKNVELRPGAITTIVLNITMTTGCNMTVQNWMTVK